VTEFKNVSELEKVLKSKKVVNTGVQKLKVVQLSFKVVFLRTSKVVVTVEYVLNEW